MKRLIPLGLMLAILFFSTAVLAAQERHTFGDSDLNYFYIDNRGGEVHDDGQGGTTHSYFLGINDVDQSAYGGIFLFANEAGQSRVEDGLIDQDFFSTSDIQLFDDVQLILEDGSPSEFLQMVLADAPNGTDISPVSFVGSQSGLQIEQVSYTSNEDPSHQFIIIEHTIINPEGSGRIYTGVSLGQFADFDVEQKSDDSDVGFNDELGTATVFQQQGPVPIIDPQQPLTTIGISAIGVEVADTIHRFESCIGGACSILVGTAEGSDAVRLDFFENESAQGDHTIPNVFDFAVTLATQIGRLEPGEQATVAYCIGNSVLDPNANPEDGVSELKLNTEDCIQFYEDEIQNCGNGLSNVGEGCDDGDFEANDACPSEPGNNGLVTCQPAFCGDGFEWTEELPAGQVAEQCDDGNNSINDDCPSGPSGTCQDAFCGDGFVLSQPSDPADFEECDDGNNDNTDSCVQIIESGELRCRDARCGDGFIQIGVEQCDDGINNSDTGACTSACQNARCGDNLVQDGVEQCDDGNTIPGDGCDEFCQTEVSPPVPPIDPGQNPPPAQTCGNGVIEGSEGCDDGNANNNDACPDGPGGSCQPAFCGDGFVFDGDNGGSEQCDDGNLFNEDECRNDCNLFLLIQGSGLNKSADNAADGGGGCALVASGGTPWFGSGFLLLLGFFGFLKKQKLQS